MPIITRNLKGPFTLRTLCAKVKVNKLAIEILTKITRRKSYNSKGK